MTPEEIASKVCPRRNDKDHLSCRLCARMITELNKYDLSSNNGIADAIFSALWLQIPDMALVRLVKSIRTCGVMD